MGIYQGNALYLYGSVGEYPGEEHFTARQVIDALAQHGSSRPISVYLNSGGGIALEGAATFNHLAAHAGRVTVLVDAIAASAASIIAMAGDEIAMRAGSLMMIHDPSGVTLGTAFDHDKTSEGLNAIAHQMAGIYARHTRKSIDAMRALMRAETWLTSEEAVRQGFADREDLAPAKTAARFEYAKYAHAPKALASGAYVWGAAPDDRRPPLRVDIVANMRKQCGIPDPVPEDHAGESSMVRSMRQMIAKRELTRNRGY